MNLHLRYYKMNGLMIRLILIFFIKIKFYWILISKDIYYKYLPNLFWIDQHFSLNSYKDFNMKVLEKVIFNDFFQQLKKSKRKEEIYNKFIKLTLLNIVFNSS